MSQTALYHLLADAVLMAHFLLVLFVVAGQLLILLGWLLDWHWARHLPFRLTHLAIILYVMTEDWLGTVCPLTRLEMWLRDQARLETHSKSFIAYWLGKLQYSFLETPHWVFAAISTIFGILVLTTYVGYPPRRRFSNPLQKITE